MYINSINCLQIQTIEMTDLGITTQNQTFTLPSNMQHNNGKFILSRACSRIVGWSECDACWHGAAGGAGPGIPGHLEIARPAELKPTVQVKSWRKIALSSYLLNLNHSSHNQVGFDGEFGAMPWLRRHRIESPLSSDCTYRKRITQCSILDSSHLTAHF